ncbi:MAG: hypothetical protein RLZZ306_336 [Bacteroidota bacterium]|jgi:hypothetical protein
MTFDSLHADTDCDCLESTFEVESKLFARKIGKPLARFSDFYSHWERNKKPAILTCNNTCMYKGLSCNEWSEESKEQVLEKYIRLINSQEKTGAISDAILIFKIKNDGGSMKYSPSKKDISHHTFFKSDTFEMNCIEIVEVINLDEYIAT